MNMHRKTIVCSILCASVVILGIFSFFFFNQQKTNIDNNCKTSLNDTISQNKGGISVVEGSLDLTVVYKSDVEKLKQKDIVVVAGRVIESNAYYNDDSYMPMTLSKLEITKNFSNVDIPKTIGFFEPGAKLNIAQTKMFVGSERDKDIKDGIEFTLDGYKPCSVGDEVILFLIKGSSYPDLDEKEKFENIYHTAGLIQGKLILSNGIYKSVTPSSLGTEYSEYTLDSFTDFYYKIR